MTERQRIETVLKREKPDRIPWTTRLDIWHGAHKRAGTLPPEYINQPVSYMYEDLGLGRQSYVRIAKAKLRGVDVVAEFNGARIFSENSPLLHFPDLTEIVPLDEPGQTTVRFRTPQGDATMVYTTNQELLDGFAAPYLTQHIVSRESDFAVVKWILQHLEIVADYQSYIDREDEIGENGFTVGLLRRVPFQTLLLDILGEIPCLYEMCDNPKRFSTLLQMLTDIDDEYVRL